MTPSMGEMAALVHSIPVTLQQQEDRLQALELRTEEIGGLKDKRRYWAGMSWLSVSCVNVSWERNWLNRKFFLRRLTTAILTDRTRWLKTYRPPPTKHAKGRLAHWNHARQPTFSRLTQAAPQSWRNGSTHGIPSVNSGLLQAMDWRI